MQISKNNLSKFEKRDFDVIIIGGGAAGLSAGIYLQRYNLSSLIIEKGRGRSFWMQNVTNYLGFPHEKSGSDLLRAGRQRFLELDGDYLNGFVEKVTKEEDKDQFSVKVKLGRKDTIYENFSAKYLIVASGIIDYLPNLDNMQNVYEFAGYTLHVCLICDGYEMNNKKTGVFVDSEQNAKIVNVLDWFTPKLTVFTNNLFQPSPELKKELTEKNFELVETEIDSFLGENHQLSGVKLKDQREINLETGLIAMGSRKHSDFLADLGLEFNKDQTLVTNEQRETSDSRIYALGDLKTGLNQVSIAVADGTIAATSIWRKIRRQRVKEFKSY